MAFVAVGTLLNSASKDSNVDLKALRTVQKLERLNAQLKLKIQRNTFKLKDFLETQYVKNKIVQSASGVSKSYQSKASFLAELLVSNDETKRRRALAKVDHVLATGSPSKVGLYLRETIYHLQEASLKKICSNRNLKELDSVSYLVNKVKKLNIHTYCGREVSG